MKDYRSENNAAMILPRLFYILSILIGLLTIHVSSVRAEMVPDEAAPAVEAMEKWLGLIDRGDYSESWKEASPLFQSHITAPKWAEALNAVRSPLGALKSRKLASALRQEKVPLPNGEIIQGDFVIAQFDTSFANMKSAVETVTFENIDGVWKASGYYIRPL